MIDWDRLRDLREEVGDESFAEVVVLFIDEVDAAIDELSSLDDAAALARELHFIKGSALNLGFSRLADLCAHGEQKAAEGDKTAVDIDSLRNVYAESRRQLLAQMPPAG
ncbi:Hpt domain-containing protein [Alkalilacustris brevis]|uniref:Hpt domain-containing protein n=1 Tax=Alkalilacustris brevis TaxID=2026338 RepID=UPI000E0CCF0E|nr:Hpt domain-containing protein [Alkalilacustris brevis]